MAEKFTMSEQAVDDGEVALEKKMKQEDQEQSHRVVVGDGGGGVLKEKKQEQEAEQSHRVVVGGDSGGGVLEEKKKQQQEEEVKKKQEEAPQQNTNRPLRDAAAIPYKIRAIKEIMTLIGAASYGFTMFMVLRAIFGRNEGLNGYVLLSMAFFIISTASASSMDAINRRRTTALVISITAWILGWGFLAAVFDYGDLAMHFSVSIIAILPLIHHALNRP